ncbi:hypothetical protein L7F22_052534 [Adiantum nelumboides]|nr:hypothetical protein [Adiantum nelumboides]
MAGINLRKACLDSFAQIAGEDAKDALVYMDAGAGEAFHFLGGLSALLPFGPRAVCSLENASAKDAEVLLCPVANDAVEKVLVITTHLLSYMHQYIHHCLQAHNAVKVFTVLTSLSEEAHAAHPDSRLGPDAFHEYKRWLMEDYQLLSQKANAEHAATEDFDIARVEKPRGVTSEVPEQIFHADAVNQVKDEAEENLDDPSVFTVKIKHLPMIICPLTSRAFVFPSSGILARAPLAELNSPLGIGFPYTKGTAGRHEDDGIPIGGTLLAHFLHHLAGQKRVIILGGEWTLAKPVGEKPIRHRIETPDGHYKRDRGPDLKIACPIFKGKKHDDLDVHVQSFERYVELKHIMEEEWEEYFPHTLKEAARKWYYHYPASKLQVYKKLKKAFILEYTDDRGDEDILSSSDDSKELLLDCSVSVVSLLSLKFDVYTLGPLSNEVGKHLTELSGLADVSVRSRKPAGLLLIDRTLDLVTPSSHGDSLLDRIFAISSRRSDEINTKSLRASPNTVCRRALDVRVADAAADLQEVWMPGVQSKELVDLLSKYELGEGVIHLKREKDLNDSTPLNKTIPMLRAMGHSVFDSVEARKNGNLDFILEKRVSDSLRVLETWLQEAVSHGSMKSSKVGAITAQNIHSLCNLLSQNLLSAAQHADLIQISKAVEIAIDPALTSKWDGLLNAEKVLLMSVGDSSQSIASQICDLVYQSIDKGNCKDQALTQPRAQNLFTLRDALTLAIVGYGLVGQSFENLLSERPFLRDEEEKLKQAVVDAILQGSEEGLGFLQGLEDSLALHRQDVPEEPTTSDSGRTEAAMEEDKEPHLEFSNEGWEAWDDEVDVDTGRGEANEIDYQRIQLKLQVRDRVETIFGRLHFVSEAKQLLLAKAKASVFDDYDGFGGSSSTRKSLIFRLLMLLFAKAEIPGMEHHASFVGRILKSGFGRFGLRQVKPKLSDSKIILVFVIGGINGVEICEAKEAQAVYKMEDEVDIVLGGTSFLTPDDMFDLLMGSSF